MRTNYKSRAARKKSIYSRLVLISVVVIFSTFLAASVIPNLPSYLLSVLYYTFITGLVIFTGSFLLFEASTSKNSRPKRRIPNEDNHFSPGYLDPGAINSSLVDPGNPAMDPFNLFDD